MDDYFLCNSKGTFFEREISLIESQTPSIIDIKEKQDTIKQRLNQILFRRNYNQPNRAIQHIFLVFAESNNY